MSRIDDYEEITMSFTFERSPVGYRLRDAFISNMLVIKEEQPQKRIAAIQTHTGISTVLVIGDRDVLMSIAEDMMGVADWDVVKGGGS